MYVAPESKILLALANIAATSTEPTSTYPDDYLPPVDLGDLED